MAQIPSGIAFLIESKNTSQSKWQKEDGFFVGLTTGYSEGQADADSAAAFAAVVAGHTGGSKEYRRMKCIELSYESR